MNHCDRVALGAGSQQLFMFRYPLQQQVKEKIAEEIKEKEPDLQEEEINERVEQEIGEKGLTDDITNLVCEDYSETQIQKDDAITNECFDTAIEEVHKAEEDKQAQIIES